MKLKRIIPTMILATMTIATSITAYAKPMPSNAIPTRAKIQFNNQSVKEANGFVVDGYTYVRGRDLADICQFPFLYDPNTKKVVISDTVEMFYFDQQEVDENLDAYQYNNENYVQVRKLVDYGLYYPEISYDNSTKVIKVTEEITLNHDKKPMTYERYMKMEYGYDSNKTTSDVQQDTLTSNVINNTSDSNTSSNNGTTVQNKDTSTISDEITAQDIQDYNEELLRLVNEARIEAGVKPLTLSDELVNLATMKADEMVELNYFDHKSPNYGMPWEMYKKVYGTSGAVGENITKSKGKTLSQYIEKGYDLTYYANVTAKSNFNSWWNSQGHKDNMLNPKYTQMGSSFSVDKDGTCVAVQMFIY